MDLTAATTQFIARARRMACVDLHILDQVVDILSSTFLLNIFNFTTYSHVENLLKPSTLLQNDFKTTFSAFNFDAGNNYPNSKFSASPSLALPVSAIGEGIEFGVQEPFITPAQNYSNTSAFQGTQNCNAVNPFQRHSGTEYPYPSKNNPPSEYYGSELHAQHPLPSYGGQQTNGSYYDSVGDRYMQHMKMQLTMDPDRLSAFQDIVNSLHRMDTLEAAQRVAYLLRHTPQLLEGFNTLLPAGYSLIVTQDSNAPVTIKTPWKSVTLVRMDGVAAAQCGTTAQTGKTDVPPSAEFMG
ncbi:hypothetical protein BJ741DRAFT_702711 [Chytriomyces cf. hyalinus JEL632]|nr:hypothetical protein BJ741DRAFT_702711 [Chytriomyces cf. hyalinus JEL632]